MGWNQLSPVREDPFGRILRRLCVFVHSSLSRYRPDARQADYGVSLSAIVRRGNFWAPVPSRAIRPVGARVLANFLNCLRLEPMLLIPAN